jgi:hypothetical protein
MLAWKPMSFFWCLGIVLQWYLSAIQLGREGILFRSKIYLNSVLADLLKARLDTTSTLCVFVCPLAEVKDSLSPSQF